MVAGSAGEGKAGRSTVGGLGSLPETKQVTIGIKDLNASGCINDVKLILIVNRDGPGLQEAARSKPPSSPHQVGKFGFARWHAAAGCQAGGRPEGQRSSKKAPPIGCWGFGLADL